MKQGSAQGQCLGGSCPRKQLLDQLCPRSPHLLHSGSPFCPVCRPVPALAPSQPEWSLCSKQLGSHGQVCFSSFLTMLLSLWGTHPDLPCLFLLRRSQLWWLPAFIPQVSTQLRRCSS